MAAQFDLVVRNGTVLDGTGGPAREADVAVQDGRIAAVGRVAGAGREEIDAKGLAVTPGFVDIHTHYDGQATWDQRFVPSSGHGVTTVVMGNCGVGFAPCRPQDRDTLIKVMEGVEDIPELVMREGVPWNWQSFPDYLDALAQRRCDIDFATQVPHAPLRVFVMGRRGVDREPATTADMAAMAALVEEGLAGGCARLHHLALAVPSHARRRAHAHHHRRRGGAGGDRPRHAPRGQGRDPASRRLPGCHARRLDRVRHAAPPGRDLGAAALLHPARHLALSRPLEDASARRSPAPTAMGCRSRARWRRGRWRSSTAWNCRSIRSRPARAIARSSACRWQASSSGCAIRRCGRGCSKEEPVYSNPNMLAFMRNVANMFVLGDPPNYTPPAAERLDARAAALGITPLELAYDLLVSGDGRTILFHPGANYTDCSDANMASMLRHENTVMALGDGGAHYGLICDASYPTHALTYWTRDRKGERWPLAWTVHQLTDVPARTVGLGDRGRLAAGYKADINLIDLEGLRVAAPHPVHNLPGGGRRLEQKAEGYRATIVSGEVTYRDGAFTGALPGRLVRGAR